MDATGCNRAFSLVVHPLTAPWSSSDPMAHPNIEVANHPHQSVLGCFKTQMTLRRLKTATSKAARQAFQDAPLVIKR
jgi:hypothetical protein